jgi:ABC-type lipoprotein export system ATPase subunit
MLHLGTQTHTTVDLGSPVTLSEADRAHGIYILGKSGTGKSTLLENFMQQDTTWRVIAYEGEIEEDREKRTGLSRATPFRPLER